MNTYRRCGAAQTGFSLVEMLLASAIGLLMMAGVIRIFVASSDTYRDQEDVAQMQENARFALELLQRDLRQAGFVGCLFSRRDNRVEGSPNQEGVISNPSVAGVALIEGTEGGANAPDAITFLVTQGIGSAIGGIDNTSITLTGGVGLRRGDYAFLAANCWRADLLQIQELSPEEPQPTSATTLTPTAMPALWHLYDTALVSQVYPAQRIRYALDGNGELERSVLRTGVAGAGNDIQPVAEGITDLQIEYGELAAGANNTLIYRSADAVVDMNNVISIRLTLTATINSRTGDEDDDLERTFTSTVFLRNFAQIP